MIFDLSPALEAAADFGWYVMPIAWTHNGVVRVRGEVIPNSDTAQTILSAGCLPPAMRPAAPVSVALGASFPDSSPYFSYSPPVVPLSYSAIDVVYASTVYPDGSWTLDTPLTRQLSEVALLLVAEWDLSPSDDTPTEWESLEPLLHAGWTNIDAEFVTHRNTIHLRGSIQIDADQANYTVPIVDAGLPNPDLGDTEVEADTDGYANPAELYVGARTPAGAYLWLFGAPVPASVTTSGVRIAGGTFQRDYPHPPTGETNARHFTSFPVDRTGTDWGADASYPHYSWDDPLSVQWRTPWWEWTVPVPGLPDLPGFGPGPVEPIPAVPNFDLAAAIASFPWPPDWVTIQFSCSMTLKYAGYQTLADAQADTGPSPEQNPQSPYANAYASTATAAVTPAVSGVSNRKFVTSGDYDASPGPYTGPLDTGFQPYYSMTSFDAECYLAPASPSYVPRKVNEPAGLEHAQLLWDPADVGIASVAMFGEAQAANMNCSWIVTPFWEAPHDFLLAGDSITFTQRSWWPTPVVATNFMMIL